MRYVLVKEAEPGNEYLKVFKSIREAHEYVCRKYSGCTWRLPTQEEFKCGIVVKYIYKMKRTIHIVEQYKLHIRRVDLEESE